MSRRTTPVIRIKVVHLHCPKEMQQVVKQAKEEAKEVRGKVAIKRKRPLKWAKLLLLNKRLVRETLMILRYSKLHKITPQVKP